MLDVRMRYPLSFSLFLHIAIILLMIVSIHFATHYKIPNHQKTIIHTELMTVHASMNEQPLLRHSNALKQEVVKKNHKANSQHQHAAQAHKRVVAHKNVKGNQLNKFVTYLYQTISAHQTYPEEARELDQEGVAKVAFTILPNGQVTKLKVIHSSGYSSLDEAALETIRNSAPFSKAHEFIHESMSLKIPIDFSENVN